MNNADTISFLGKKVQHKVQLLIMPRSNKGIPIYLCMVFNQVSCQKWSGAWKIIEMVY